MNDMPPFEIPEDLTGQIDDLLSCSKVIVAVSLLRNTLSYSISDAKHAIGTRFRERFPEQFSSYRDLGDEG